MKKEEKIVKEIIAEVEEYASALAEPSCEELSMVALASLAYWDEEHFVPIRTEICRAGGCTEEEIAREDWDYLFELIKKRGGEDPMYYAPALPEYTDPIWSRCSAIEDRWREEKAWEDRKFYKEPEDFWAF